METCKQQLRAHFKKLREGIPANERASLDAGIARQVRALPEYKQAQLVLPYLAFGAEVETRGIIEAAWADDKVVALPRCVPGTRDMRWYVVNSYDGLVTSNLGVEEPAENPACEIDPAAFEGALCLVPGLTFDKHGYRLGYGGGFYDTFLAHFTGTSVGLCRSCQMSRNVEARDTHDLPVNLVVTESEAIRVNAFR